MCLIDIMPIEYLIDEKYKSAVESVSWCDDNGYRRGYYRCPGCGKGRKIQMHVLIMNLERYPDVCPCSNHLIQNGYHVHHINHIRNDNRAENLDVLTASKDFSETDTPNTSKYNGVSWHKGAKKWHAQCSVDGKKVYLGYFQDEKLAALAYNAFVVQNNLKHRDLNDVPKVKITIKKKSPPVTSHDSYLVTKGEGDI